MQVFLTDMETPIRCKKTHGKINLLTLILWPAWSFPKFTTLFSYERGGEKITVLVIMGKRYTLESIQVLVNEHLNSDAQVALLYHNNGRVTWRVFPPKPPTNSKISAGMVDFLRPSKIKLSAGLKELLNLTTAQEHDGVITGQPVDAAGTTTGQPVDESSINFAFSRASMVFLACDQVDDTYVNDKPSKAIAVIPVATAINGTLTLSSPTSAVFTENYDRKLSFHLTDKRGNELPVKQMLAYLTIND